LRGNQSRRKQTAKTNPKPTTTTAVVVVLIIKQLHDVRNILEVAFQKRRTVARIICTTCNVVCFFIFFAIIVIKYFLQLLFSLQYFQRIFMSSTKRPISTTISGKHE